MSNPIEVWLRMDGLQVICTIVNPDESAYSHDIRSLSMRGSQREVSAHLIANGLRPDGNWQIEAMDRHDAVAEVWRRFTPPG